MIATEINKYLGENNIKMTDLCKKAGLSNYRVGKALSYDRKMKIDEYIKICEALGLSYEYFFDQLKSDEC